jgi:hypothetical protein
MRVVGRYFAIGATLGSVTGFAALVLIWVWLSIRLGFFGLLLGWIPGGVVGAFLWLMMVVFWGPILIVGAMASLALVLLRAHAWRGGTSWDETPARPSDEVHGSHDMEASPDAASPPVDEQPAAAPAGEPVTPPSGQAAPPEPSSSQAAPAPAPIQTPSDDLGGDAAAAGDTSHKHPR